MRQAGVNNSEQPIQVAEVSLRPQCVYADGRGVTINASHNDTQLCVCSDVFLVRDTAWRHCSMNINSRNHVSPAVIVPPGFVCHIALGPGYNRAAVRILIQELTALGTTTMFVALHVNVTPEPMLLLSELAAGPPARCLIIAGNSRAVFGLITAPALHRSIRATIGAGGLIGILVGARPLIEATRLLAELPAAALFFQDSSIGVFVEQLLRAV